MHSTLFTDEAHKDYVDFWKAALGGVDNDFYFRQPWLSYPDDHQESTTEEVRLPEDMTRLIHDISRGQDIGVLVVIVSSLSFLLHKYTGVPVIQIDSPALKQELDSEYAGNAVPLIIPVHSNGSIRDHLNRIRRDAANVYSYQNFPFGKLAEVLLNRPISKSNVAVRFNDLHDPSFRAGEYDLCVVVSGNPLRIELHGRAPAFSREYLRTLARHFVNVTAACSDLSLPLNRIDVMGAEERQRILVGYNSTARDFPLHKTIPELFYEQVKKSNHNIAVRSHAKDVSYDELNRMSNRLARILQNEYSVRPGDVVGVVTHRSEWLIAGLLGVLKAGAVYLPLDADYPQERLQFMLSNASVKLLLVHSDHLPGLGALYETAMFALDLQLPMLDTAEPDLETRCTAADPAYVIYTSGSTGQPKGVVLCHRGFINMVLHHIEAFHIDSSDRLLQFYNQCFDSSLFEMFVALFSGATLVMADRTTISDPARLSGYIEEQKVTTLTLPPIYLSTLHRERLETVRRFISAGDNCRVDDAAFFARTKDYYNSYGPTETSVCVTHYKVDPQVRYGSRIPIGKAISNTSIYLLDDDLTPVPEGVPGEICVAGVSLASGYLNRDDLTAEKFVASPFVPGERLYKTGDLGVWLPGVNLELIGRKDNQVKIRGYRIELGEIEATLLQHPDVEETVVVAREDQSGNKRLIAYVAGHGPIENAGLRAFLKAKLPEFMMPAAFVVMDKMPLTANGKIDRKALPDPDAPDFRKAASIDVPQNETQEILARIWQDVLGIGHVGMNDNLFEIGGDSILVIQIVSRARQAGIKLAPAQLFERQTIAELSKVAVPARPSTGADEHIDGAAPLTAVQEWFFEQDIAERHHFNQSVMLEIRPGLDAAIAEEATRKLLEHHDALRLRFFQSNGRWVAEHGPLPDAAPFSVVDVSHLSTPDQDEAILASATDLQTRFDLSSGPLIHVRLFLLGSGRPARILFIAHHLVVDGVSWRVLLEDFHAVCSRMDLPRKTTSYRAWATRLREEARSVGEHGYWRSSRRLQVKPIPVDYAYGPHENTVDTAREATIELDEAATAALLHEAPKAYNTEINDLLLTALARTFVEWTGQETMLIDLEGHGREDLFEDLDTSRTVGWLTTLFPVLLDVHRNAAPGEALKSVKEQLHAVPRRGIGYGMLRYLSDDTAHINELKAFPRSDVVFNYLGQTGRVLAQGLSWVPILGLNGPEQSARSKRTHLLEVGAIVIDGRLKVSWTFSEKVHSKSTIENVARLYEETLRGLIRHCTTAETRQYTPSDFPAARLDQKSLDALIARIKM